MKVRRTPNTASTGLQGLRLAVTNGVTVTRDGSLNQIERTLLKAFRALSPDWQKWILEWVEYANDRLQVGGSVRARS